MHGPGSPPRGRGKVDGPPAQVGRGRITPAQAGRSPYFLYGKKDYKDHPRIGGEKAELTAAVISAMGSPPRRRGKGYREFGIDISDRITPAQAGKSVAPRQKRSALWDHPRVGGEKGTRRSHGMAVPGSPPRGRGKANWHCVRRPALRITPAQAGKRTRSWRAYGCPWDHPRVGGEKKGVRHWWALPRGSPPRWRGKATFSGRSDPGVGITPAWAGKSRIDKLEWIPVKDHPRVGGEKPVGYDLLQRPAGITPAWAGKRYCRQSPPRAGWDHPRVGGEKYRETFPVPQSVGSPPRGRGKAPVFRYAG